MKQLLVLFALLMTVTISGWADPVPVITESLDALSTSSDTPQPVTAEEDLEILSWSPARAIAETPSLWTILGLEASPTAPAHRPLACLDSTCMAECFGEEAVCSEVICPANCGTNPSCLAPCYQQCGVAYASCRADCRRPCSP